MDSGDSKAVYSKTYFLKYKQAAPTEGSSTNSLKLTFTITIQKCRRLGGEKEC
jgi:hypothetical protein